MKRLNFLEPDWFSLIVYSYQDPTVCRLLSELKAQSSGQYFNYYHEETNTTRKVVSSPFYRYNLELFKGVFLQIGYKGPRGLSGHPNAVIQFQGSFFLEYSFDNLLATLHDVMYFLGYPSGSFIRYSVSRLDLRVDFLADLQEFDVYGTMRKITSSNYRRNCDGRLTGIDNLKKGSQSMVTFSFYDKAEEQKKIFSSRYLALLSASGISIPEDKTVYRVEYRFNPLYWQTRNVYLRSDDDLHGFFNDIVLHYSYAVERYTPHFKGFDPASLCSSYNLAPVQMIRNQEVGERLFKQALGVLSSYMSASQIPKAELLRMIDEQLQDKPADRSEFKNLFLMKSS